MNLLSFLLFSVPITCAYTHILISNETFQDHSAAFGPMVSPNGELGFLAKPADDPTGCFLAEPPCTNWIALVKRGGCSFITKVRAMQKSGAIAVVVGDLESTDWITMFASGDTSDVLIPSVFLAKDEYKRVLHLTESLDSPIMTVLQYDKKIMDWPLKYVFFVTALSPFILTIFLYVSWKIRQRVRQRNELASTSAVSKLGIKIFSAKEKDEDCAICLEEYEQGNELRLLPCNHQFHTLCVDAWLLTQKKLCPICKRDITLKV